MRREPSIRLKNLDPIDQAMANEMAVFDSLPFRLREFLKEHGDYFRSCDVRSILSQEGGDVDSTLAFLHKYVASIREEAT